MAAERGHRVTLVERGSRARRAVPARRLVSRRATRSLDLLAWYARRARRNSASTCVSGRRPPPTSSPRPVPIASSSPRAPSRRGRLPARRCRSSIACPAPSVPTPCRSTTCSRHGTDRRSRPGRRRRRRLARPGHRHVPRRAGPRCHDRDVGGGRGWWPRSQRRGRALAGSIRGGGRNDIDRRPSSSPGMARVPPSGRR